MKASPRARAAFVLALALLLIVWVGKLCQRVRRAGVFAGRKLRRENEVAPEVSAGDHGRGTDASTGASTGASAGVGIWLGQTARCSVFGGGRKLVVTDAALDARRASASDVRRVRVFFAVRRTVGEKTELSWVGEGGGLVLGLEYLAKDEACVTISGREVGDVLERLERGGGGIRLGLVVGGERVDVEIGLGCFAGLGKVPPGLSPPEKCEDARGAVQVTAVGEGRGKGREIALFAARSLYGTAFFETVVVGVVPEYGVGEIQRRCAGLREADCASVLRLANLGAMQTVRRGVEKEFEALHVPREDWPRVVLFFFCRLGGGWGRACGERKLLARVAHAMFAPYHHWTSVALDVDEFFYDEAAAMPQPNKTRGRLASAEARFHQMRELTQREELFFGNSGGVLELGVDRDQMANFTVRVMLSLPFQLTGSEGRFVPLNFGGCYADRGRAAGKVIGAVSCMSSTAFRTGFAANPAGLSPSSLFNAGSNVSSSGAATLNIYRVVASASPRQGSCVYNANVNTDSLCSMSPRENLRCPAEFLFWVDWLHFPKTGSSFSLTALQYACDEQISAEIAESSESKTVLRLRDELHDRSLRSKCQRGLRHFHAPLRNSTGAHAGFRIRDVATMFRNPLSRLASGLVHDYHGCFTRDLSNISTRGELCASLTGSSNATELRKAYRVIDMYARCVEGCQTRMVSGEGECGHYKAPAIGPEQSVGAVLKDAIGKVRSFGFVGLTEEWAASICLWKRTFPRPSGRDYLRQFEESNTRPSNSSACKRQVEKYLEGRGWHDPLDEPLYDAARTVFLDRVGRCSEWSKSGAGILKHATFGHA